DEPLLIHLDGEDCRVAVAVIVLGDRLCERVVQVLQAMRKDVREAHHHGCGQIPRLQTFDDFVEVDVASRLRIGPHHQVPGRIDAEIALAPRIDVVKLQGVFDAPGLGGIELASAIQGALGVYGHVRESGMFIGENRRDDFRDTLHVFRGPGNGPGRVFHWRKSSRRFPRDATRFAAGPGAARPVAYWRKSSRRFPRDATRFAAGQGAALARFASGIADDGAAGVADPLAPGAGVEARTFETRYLYGEEVVACGHARAAHADRSVGRYPFERLRKPLAQRAAIEESTRAVQVVRERMIACAWDVAGDGIDRLPAACEPFGAAGVDQHLIGGSDFPLADETLEL